jgi:hypothetical protein
LEDVRHSSVLYVCKYFVVRTDLAEDVWVADDDEQSLGPGDRHVEPKSKKKELYKFFMVSFCSTFYR